MVETDPELFLRHQSPEEFILTENSYSDNELLENIHLKKYHNYSEISQRSEFVRAIHFDLFPVQSLKLKNESCCGIYNICYIFWGEGKRDVLIDTFLPTSSDFL